MTAVISTLYFIAIYQLFKQLKEAKIFALMILVIMDIGVMYAALRQCLAISMFIFMILALQKNKTTNSIIYALLAILFHKSAIFAIIPIFLLFILQKTQILSRYCADFIKSAQYLVLGVDNKHNM